MKKLFNINGKRPIRICKNCGHDHIQETGDNNPEGVYHYELLSLCCYCKCERYKSKGDKEYG
jgi:hypothetical protein